MIRSKDFPKLSDVERYYKDPELIIGEVLFLILTLSNVFIVYRLLYDVVPYPIFVTWWQLLQGLFMAWVLGDLGEEFPKLSYFPHIRLVPELIRELLVPTLVYCGMLVLANILLSKSPTPATFPIIVSFTVILHHIVRFIGCGEEYMGLRWQSMSILFLAFILGCTDHKTMGIGILPWALAYAFIAALFRAGYLQKIMHVVEGKGNALHNHQHIIGILILPLLWIPLGEWKALTSMPYDFTNLFTYQMWGCLITIGTLPFVKNIVSNRLIRKTGQAPWRFLELISIFLVFCIGLSFGIPNWQGWIAILLVILGRSIGAIDALKNAEDAANHVSNFINSNQTNTQYNPVQDNIDGDTPLISNNEHQSFSNSESDDENI